MPKNVKFQCFMYLGLYIEKPARIIDPLCTYRPILKGYSHNIHSLYFVY